MACAKRKDSDQHVQSDQILVFSHIQCMKLGELKTEESDQFVPRATVLTWLTVSNHTTQLAVIQESLLEYF